MAKCKSCNQLFDSNFGFCPYCGAEKSKEELNKIQEAMEKAEAEFERDALISMDLSQITYVCDVCHTVNSIHTAKCKFCGKRRPRNEFINALTTYKKSKEVKSDLDVQIKDNLIVNEQNDVVSQLENPMPATQLYRFEPSPEAQIFVQNTNFTQAQTTVQPIVIVPYLNPNQPLWQYPQQQVYRFEAYPEVNVEVLDEKVDAKIAIKTKDKEYQAPSAKKKAWIGGLINIIIVLLVLTASVLSSFSGLIKDVSGVGMYVGFIAVLQGIAGGEYLGAQIESTYINFLNASNTSLTAGMLLPLCFAVSSLVLLIILIRGIGRLILNDARNKGFFISMVNLVFVTLSVVGLMIVTKGFENLNIFIMNIGFAPIAMFIGAVALVIMAFISKKTHVKVEKVKRRNLINKK